MRPDSRRGFVEAGGRRLSYFSAGGPADGPTILLIHGSGVSARCWINQLGGLAGTLSVLAVDLPGYGESGTSDAASVEEYAEVLEGVLNALGTGRVIAAGHSLGGAVAMALAARRPEAVRGLVLLSSCEKLPHSDGTAERLLAALLFVPGAPAGAVSVGMEELRSCRPETILKDMRAAKAMDLGETAARLDVPTLILCGSRDKLTPPALSALRFRRSA